MDSTHFRHLTPEEKNKALGMAAAYNNSATVKILIATYDIDLNYQDNILGRTALMWAVKNGCADIVDILIAAGANLHIADYNGQTPYMLMKAEPEPIENKENRYFSDEYRGFPLNHYYNPIIFSGENTVSASQERNEVTPQPEKANENCRVM